MSQQELLIEVAGALRRLRIPFMLTGSVAGGLLGNPRMTHDLDIVVDLSWKHVDELIAAFPPPRFYTDPDSVRSAISRGGHFNILDTDTGDKVDFWMLGDTPFDAERFARRRSIDYFGTSIDVSTAEDLILKKLHFASDIGGSERQSDDALRIARFNRGSLDLAYMDRWAARIGVAHAWARIRTQAGLD